MSQQRVVHITSVHSLFDTRIFHKECQSLLRAPYDVFCVMPHRRDETVNGVRIVAVPEARNRLHRMTITAVRIYLRARELDADLYHSHDPELIPIGLLLRAQGKQVIYDIHEDVPRQILSKHYLPWYVRRPLHWITELVETHAASLFSALVVATPAIAERFDSVNPNTVVVRNYASLHDLVFSTRIAWNQRPYSVAYVGRLSPDKGVGEMVTAMAYVSRRREAILHLAGTFSMTEARNRVIQQPGWSHVREWGVLDRHGVASLLGEVRGGMVVLHPVSRFVVSLPVKMFEYMSAGIPVIASDFPLWREIIGGADCGLLVDPLDPRAIAGAIEYLFTHADEAEAMGRRGREAVENQYNWAFEADKLLQCYADLFSRH